MYSGVTMYKWLKKINKHKYGLYLLFTISLSINSTYFSTLSLLSFHSSPLFLTPPPRGWVLFVSRQVDSSGTETEGGKEGRKEGRMEVGI